MKQLKKWLSCLLALVMLCSTLALTAGTANAEEKQSVEEVLSEIQTQRGFIHGQTAYVTGNCYAFVAAVCERLYGVTYMGEGLYDSYKCAHRSGNFYTVDEMMTGSSLNSDTVEAMKQFFLNNAYPGDIVHYGRPGGGTHTFMVQSVDEEKLVVFQANWPRKDLPYSSCHIDTIYWDSLAETGKSVYNSDGSLYSMNEIFGNRMRGGAIGISVNRYAAYGELYNTPAEQQAVAEEENAALKLEMQLEAADNNTDNTETEGTAYGNVTSDTVVRQAAM